MMLQFLLAFLLLGSAPQLPGNSSVCLTYCKRGFLPPPLSLALPLLLSSPLLSLSLLSLFPSPVSSLYMVRASWPLLLLLLPFPLPAFL